MKIPALHRWPTSPRAAIALQERLAPRVSLVRAPARVRFYGGADVAFSRDGSQVVAGVIIWDSEADAVIEQRVARAPCRLPYIPGLLSFRELPGVLAALRKLRKTPEVMLGDAQGLAHPRRLGLASHLGLWIRLPTVGCAKSRLCGQHSEPAAAKGSRAALRHNGERVGTVLRTRDDVKPLFVSPGHMCDHASAVRLTLAATTKYRLPEPTRLAHQLVTRVRST
jgi:deoxyribonuclease V